MKSRCFVLLIVCISILSPGCGSDGGGSGPGGGSSNHPAANGFDALADAYAATAGRYTKILTSADAFGPAIGSVFAAVKLEAGKGLPSCVPVEIADTVFDYDTETQSYVATEEGGAPPGGVRFKLYEVDENGDPSLPLVLSGFFNVHCDEVNGNTVVVVCDPAGNNVFDIGFAVLFIDPPAYIINTSEGALYDPAGPHAVTLLFSAEGSIYGSMSTRLTMSEGFEFYDPRAEGFQAHAGIDDADLDESGAPFPPYYGFAAGATQSNEVQNLVWNGSVGGSVFDDGSLLNVVQGEVAPLELEDRVAETNGILACFSGHYRDPLVESSSANCKTGTIETPIPVGTTGLAAIHDGYVALVEVLESMSASLAAVLPLIVR